VVGATGFEGQKESKYHFTADGGALVEAGCASEDVCITLTWMHPQRRATSPAIKNNRVFMVTSQVGRQARLWMRAWLLNLVDQISLFECPNSRTASIVLKR
jgi:hypothetical protein